MCCSRHPYIFLLQTVHSFNNLIVTETYGYVSMYYGLYITETILAVPGFSSGFSKPLLCNNMIG